MCYSGIKYAAGRKSADIVINCRQHSSITKVEFDFNKLGYQDSNTFHVDSSFSTLLPISVRGTDTSGKNWHITLEPLNLVWQGAPIPQGAMYNQGQKGSIIEMFGWPYADIKAECATLGKMGWMGVKVFPP